MLNHSGELAHNSSRLSKKRRRTTGRPLYETEDSCDCGGRALANAILERKSLLGIKTRDCTDCDFCACPVFKYRQRTGNGDAESRAGASCGGGQRNGQDCSTEA